ncbi:MULTISPECIES: hypothetical protein [Acinetobacter]|uniref:hypothetical protein n=1 Tax=Acinetobacter TaxID=469 RepID=UPI0015D2EDA3|nr:MULTISPECIES: hypothetical protein [Acinetobacter]WKT74339.1 hypothetical protein Q3F87_06675 [Acinetobacter variabilis]
MSNSLYYFPTNREDILLILSSINFNFKNTPLNIKVAMGPKQIPYQFNGSIGPNEVMALSGHEKNFPVLIASETKIKKGNLNLSDIHHLVFRSQQEMDDFKFRAIAEFDTESIKSLVNPALFESFAKQEKKMTMIQLQNTENYQSHIVSGLLNLLHVARWKGYDLTTFDHFFQRDENSIRSLIELILDLSGSTYQKNYLTLAIIQTILENGKLSSASLLENIKNKWLDLWAEEAPPSDEMVWFRYMNSIINSTQALNLDKLTDEGGSVFLRAATLLIMSDDLNILKSFNDQSPNIGLKVLNYAAFLIGLKSPLYRRSWVDKKDSVYLLEEFASAVESKRLGKLIQPLKKALYLSQGTFVKFSEVNGTKISVYHIKQSYYRTVLEDNKKQPDSVDIWIFDKQMKRYYVDWVSNPNDEEIEKLVKLFDKVNHRK